MTPNEFHKVLSSFNLNSLSEKDLIEIRNALCQKLSEANFIINCNKHFKSHFPSEETTNS